MAQFTVEIKVAFRYVIEARTMTDATASAGDRIRAAMATVDHPWVTSDIHTHRVEEPGPEDGAIH